MPLMEQQTDRGPGLHVAGVSIRTPHVKRYIRNGRLFLLPIPGRAYYGLSKKTTQTVTHLAALCGIHEALYGAATIDGASRLQRLVQRFLRTVARNDLCRLHRNQSRSIAGRTSFSILQDG